MNKKQTREYLNLSDDALIAGGHEGLVKWRKEATAWCDGAKIEIQTYHGSWVELIIQNPVFDAYAYRIARPTLKIGDRECPMPVNICYSDFGNYGVSLTYDKVEDAKACIEALRAQMEGR